MNIVLLGIQGTGKGSLIINLKKQRDFTLISLGDLLREEVKSGSELGKYIKEIQDSGRLVDLDIVMNTLRSKLKGVKGDVIFDGFPRNIAQAEELKKLLKIDLVIFLDLDKATARNRLMNRLTCEQCNFVTSRLATHSEVCPVCGGRLRTRSDDTKAGIDQRFKVFEQESLPLIDFYQNMKVKVAKIDASKSQMDILSEVLKVIN